MTKLLSEAMVLLNKLGLTEEHLMTIEQSMKSYAADTLNVAKPLIEKRENPETVRKFIEPHGLTYSGKSKLFS